MIKKGQRLLVWSLQSFNNGGFLNGEPAFARQTTNSDSVIVCVIRNFNGEKKIDESYEIYTRQVKEVSKCNWKAKNKLKKIRKKVMANTYIK